MADTSHRNAFLIHLAAYLAVNAILLAINATEALEPGVARNWWAIWPLCGWGIGLAAHGLALWAERHTKKGQILADADVRGVAVHLFVYLAVNALLISINLSSSSETLWAIWPLLGWGIGLAAHAWLAYRAVLHKTMEHYATEQQVLTEIQLEAQASQIAAAVEQKKKKQPDTRKRRKPAAAKTTRKTAIKRKNTAKRAPARKAKKPASKKR
jgi:hypothetical protein